MKGRMDFKFETMRGELVAAIERAINEEVAQAHRSGAHPAARAFQIPDLIRTEINLLPEGIRGCAWWRSSGWTCRPIAGRVPARPSGPIRVTDYKSKGKINKRIYVELEGDRAGGNGVPKKWQQCDRDSKAGQEEIEPRTHKKNVKNTGSPVQVRPGSARSIKNEKCKAPPQHPQRRLRFGAKYLHRAQRHREEGYSESSPESLSVDPVDSVVKNPPQT